MSWRCIMLYCVILFTLRLWQPKRFRNYNFPRRTIRPNSEYTSNSNVNNNTATASAVRGHKQSSLEEFRLRSLPVWSPIRSFVSTGCILGNAGRSTGGSIRYDAILLVEHSCTGSNIPAALPTTHTMVRLRMCCLQAKIKGPGASLPSNKKSWLSPDMDRIDKSNASPIRPETESVLGSQGWRQSGNSEEAVEDAVKGSREKSKEAAHLPKNSQLTNFWRAFSEKTDGVRQSTLSAAYPKFDEASCLQSLLGFESVDCELIHQLIQSSPIKNCTLDPVPTWIIKQYASELVPFITVYCTTSLRDGSFPDSQKNAIVTPILKKANLDAHAAANYRLISNLSYLSEAIGTLCQQTVEWIPVDQQPASIGAICLEKVPLNRVGRIEGPVRHLRSGRWENGDVTRATWPECGIRHSRSSNPLWQSALRVWTGWFRSKLVQILPNQPNNLFSLQRADIRNRLHSLRRATGIGAWSNPLHSLRGLEPST